jgi:hypothetical protein
MLPNLTANEARVIGCLMEKSVITPDQYPLTLNALVAACNQKSGRDPVMSLQPGEAQRATRDLSAKHLVVTKEDFKRGTEKYQQRFCNTSYSDYRFNPAQFAIVCLLLLRGPQTPGELRARSGRLHTFADNAAVVDTLNSLIQQDHDPLVAQLPRTPGRKDCEYMHLFSGPIDVAAHAAQALATKAAGAPERANLSDLVERVSQLEEEVAKLKATLQG